MVKIYLNNNTTIPVRKSKQLKFSMQSPVFDNDATGKRLKISNYSIIYRISICEKFTIQKIYNATIYNRA